jgi:hypothetical protein
MSATNDTLIVRMAAVRIVLTTTMTAMAA